MFRVPWALHSWEINEVAGAAGFSAHHEEGDCLNDLFCRVCLAAKQNLCSKQGPRSTQAAMADLSVIVTGTDDCGSSLSAFQLLSLITEAEA